VIRTVILLCVLTVAAVGLARAEEPTVVMLSCDGTMTDFVNSGDKLTGTPVAKQPIRALSIIVDLAAKTVTFDGRRLALDTADDALVGFSSGHFPDDDVLGSIDRITGKTEVSETTVRGSERWSSERWSYYDLVCKATTRVF
jgi:hypothetical protein